MYFEENMLAPLVAQHIFFFVIFTEMIQRSEMKLMTTQSCCDQASIRDKDHIYWTVKRPRIEKKNIHLDFFFKISCGFCKLVSGNISSSV